MGKKDMVKRELLLEVAGALGTDCLSDLRYLENPVRIRKILSDIPVEKYSSVEWIDAAGYIGTGMYQMRQRFSSAEEARNYLISGKNSVKA